jgi:hypothetical protein
MLSSVLNSERAVQVNIAIMRTFFVVFDAIRRLMAVPEPKEKKIGFRVREKIARYGTSSR